MADSIPGPGSAAVPVEKVTATRTAGQPDGRMDADCEVLVVGAGPAGLAAAVTAADAGAQVILVDGNLRPGGQYWRQPGGPRMRLEADHAPRALVRWTTAVRAHCSAGRLRFHPGAWVVTLEPQETGWRARLTDGLDDRATQPDPTARAESAQIESTALPSVISATTIVLALGGADRQLPFPGWDLPGVIAAGGAQALWKGSGVRAGSRVVVAGSGPFLLPVATTLRAAGATVLAVCDAASPMGWSRQLDVVLRQPRRVVEALGYGAALAAGRVPYLTRTVVRRAIAGPAGSVASVELGKVDREGGLLGRSATKLVKADLLVTGWGFTPVIDLALQAGAETRVDADGSLVVLCDADQQTSRPGLYVAGESCGVGGATLAQGEGRLAGLMAAAQSRAGASPDPRRAARLRRQIRGGRTFAAAMHRVYPVPNRWTEWLEDDTLLCRCEEATVAEVKAAVELGARDARTVKLLTRAGMGWCQGRTCGFAAVCLTGSLTDRPPRPQDLRDLATRPLAAPVTLGELADWQLDP